MSGISLYSASYFPPPPFPPFHSSFKHSAPLQNLFWEFWELCPQITSQVSLQDAGDSLVQWGARRAPGRACGGALQTLKLQDAVDGAL